MWLVGVDFDYRKPEDEVCLVTITCSEKSLEELFDKLEMVNEKGTQNDAQMSFDFDNS